MSTNFTTKTRKKAATVHVGKKEKYPIDTPASAKSALRLINNAKPSLMTSQRAAVKARAARYGVKPKPGSAASA